MSEERRRILALLAEGRVTVDEAERLLAAVGRSEADSTPGSDPRFLRVVVEGKEKAKEEGKEKEIHVNIRIPVQLLKSGINLGAMLEGEVGTKVGETLEKRGIPLDLTRLRSPEIDALVESLADLSIDIDDGDQKIRVFCE